jgi:hypothetical protein
MQPLVSVVVPVFNGMPYLIELARSITGQTYSNLEIIFSDGGSTDDSLEFLTTLNDPRIRTIRMPAGTSAAQNWTAATMEAHGAFTKLICQDDVLYPHAITMQVHDLTEHSQAVMAVAQRDIIDANSRIVYRRRGLSGIPASLGATIEGAQLVRACYLQGTNIIGEPLAVLFRTDALQRAMPWDDSDPLMLDLSTYEKVAPSGPVAVRRGSIGAFRVSATSWSTRIASAQGQQTRRWQDRYATAHAPELSHADRTRAVLGRHITTTARRIVYVGLRARGSLTTSTSPPSDRSGADT